MHRRIAGLHFSMMIGRFLTFGALFFAVALLLMAARSCHQFQTAKSDPALSPDTTTRDPRVAAGVAGPPVVASTPDALPDPVRPPLEGQPALVAPNQNDLVTTDCAFLSARLGAAGTAPEVEVRLVLDLLNTYRRVLGAYPAGEDNRQFVNALLGANKEKLPFLPGTHPRLNTKGELTDAWGTAFFFHQLARDKVEVRSAGPDRRMYTADDSIAGKSQIRLEEE